MKFSTSYEISDSDIQNLGSYLNIINGYVATGDYHSASGNIDYLDDKNIASMVIEYIPRKGFSIMYTRSENNINVRTLWSFNGAEDFVNFHRTEADILIPVCSFIDTMALEECIKQYMQDPLNVEMNTVWISGEKLEWPEGY